MFLIWASLTLHMYKNGQRWPHFKFAWTLQICKSIFSSRKTEWLHSLLPNLSNPSLKIFHPPPPPKAINNDWSLSYLKNWLCMLDVKYCMFTLTDVKYWMNCNFSTLFLCVDRELNNNELSTISAGTFGNMSKLEWL